jgi:membrane peptidoglycan carboxypeptidase
MKVILGSVFFILSLTIRAEVNPGHVESMLDQMVRENVISKEEAEKAKFRMKSMNKEQWSQINQKAKELANRMPASVEPSKNKIEEVHGIDLDGAQFKQIQDDMKKIMPEYRD